MCSGKCQDSFSVAPFGFTEQCTVCRHGCSNQGCDAGRDRVIRCTQRFFTQRNKVLNVNICQIHEKAHVTENLTQTAFRKVDKVSPNATAHKIE